MVVTGRVRNMRQLGPFIHKLCYGKETFRLRRRNQRRRKYTSAHKKRFLFFILSPQLTEKLKLTCKDSVISALFSSCFTAAVLCYVTHITVVWPLF